ncbi:MAG: DUF6851 domain-containing protein [Planctomycetota bacterium]
MMKYRIQTITLIAAALLLGPVAMAADVATQLQILSGDNQVAPANTRLLGVVCALVRDANDVPVKGVTVTWGDITGGGTLFNAVQPTDEHGIATLGGWTLGPTAGTNTISASSPNLPTVTYTATATAPLPPDNLVIQWSTQLITVFQNGNVAPTVSSRALATLHTSIYDAWAAYDARAVGTQLGSQLRRPEIERTEANKNIAISYAAYRTLVDLFPSQKSNYDALMTALNLDTSVVTTDPSTPAGVGNAAAAANLAFRHADGSNQLGTLNPGAYTDYTSFTPVNNVNTLNDPSKWQPLLQPNGNPQVFTTAHWYLVKTFAIGTSEERTRLMPKPPAKFGTKAYDRQAKEVLDLSAGLTDYTKSVAAYWVDKAGTVTPPGHWFDFGFFVSRRDKHTLDEDVKMFFVLGNAMLDAGVEVWDIKRHYESVRPITAIRLLNKNKTIQAWGGPQQGTQSIPGETWQSYIPTPPFAEYVSGHSTFSGAGAHVLQLCTKSPLFGMKLDVPASFVAIELNTPAQPLSFNWPRFIDAANDAGISRRIGGIHFKDGDLQGRALGKRIGLLAFKKAQAYFTGKIAMPAQ